MSSGVIAFGNAARLLRSEALRRRHEGFPNWCLDLLDLAEALNRIAGADDAVEQWLALREEFAVVIKDLSPNAAAAVALLNGRC